MSKKNTIKVLILFFSFSILISSCSFLKDSETAKLRKEIEELKKKNTDETEKPSDPSAPDLEKTKKIVKISEGYLSLRDEPDAKTGKLIAKIPNGASVMAGECQKELITIGGLEGHWCKITYKDQEGWAFDAWLADEGTEKESSNANSNYLITAKSAGDIRFGMTIGEARKVLKGAKFSRDMDAGEGVIIAVEEGGKSLLWLYTDASVEDTTPIKNSEKIAGITIFDPRYKTAEGVHCQTTVVDAEKQYGKLKNIWMEGLTGNEIATFTNAPKGINFWVSPGKLVMKDGQYNTAGMYGEKDPDNTSIFNKGAVISMISIPAYGQ